MFRRAYSGGINGIDCSIVNVEADVSNGLPEFVIVGYLASEVKEARDRVRTAIKNSDFQLPPKRITVNLSPADLKKKGTTYDLSIATAILSASGYIKSDKLEDTFIIGELSLGGEVKRVNGILPLIYGAMKAGFKRCILPESNAAEGAVIKEMEIIGVKTLAQMADYLNDKVNIEVKTVDTDKLFEERFDNYRIDFDEICGQESLKRAIEVAVCGRHNILIIGPPGSGKTMAVERIPTIMPKLTFDESIEISKVYSVCGMLDNDNILVNKRPFRSPHHTITTSKLIGGGVNAKPGEISLATGGVLFLDEFPEFKKYSIETLRQPLEDKHIVISRVNGTYKYPADFMLVAAMNPCNCGFYPDRNKCNCSLNAINAYMSKISRPLLSRIDICIEVPSIDFTSLKSKTKGESSKHIRERIVKAREIQTARYKEYDIDFNSRLTVKMLEEFCKLDRESEELLNMYFEKYNMSARVYHRLLKVARTIADLEGSKDINKKHIAECICYRSVDRKFWG